MRYVGDSIISAGLFCGDVLVVDRSLSPAFGEVVVAVVDGRLSVKRFRSSGVVQVWGVVTASIHSLIPK